MLLRNSYALFAFAILLSLAATAGCQRRRKTVAYVSPPVDAENAYWRERYQENRPAAPARLSIPPKPIPDNQFGEFSEPLYQGLDQQPALPDFPGEAPAPPLLSASGVDQLPATTPVAPTPRRPASRMVNPAPGEVEPRGLAGLRVDGHLYPVEQLIYGGAFPDLEQPEGYRLMPGDQLTLTVRNHPEFSGPLTIQPDGSVRLPNTPDLVVLRGLTSSLAAAAITTALAPYVKGEAEARVQTNRAEGGYYFVFGDVRQPGRFPMGLEPLKLSEAVLAANWEANPARREQDQEDLGPSFPAAYPRGNYSAPRSSDLARVVLVTPHRSQPVRSVHDVRSALLGMTGDDPLLRPGQIVIVPSLNASLNAAWGLEAVTTAAPPEREFSYSSTPARLPELATPVRTRPSEEKTRNAGVEENLATAAALSTSSDPARSVRLPETYTDYRDAKSRRSRASGERKVNQLPGW